MEIIALIVVSIVCIIFVSKYFRLKNKVKKTLDEYYSPLRKGFYKEDCASTNLMTQVKTDYTAIIHVTEVERYKNGISKIKLENIDIVAMGSINNETSKQYIKSNFSIFINTSNVTWLETEDDIRELRRLKLEKLKNSIK